MPRRSGPKYLPKSRGVDCPDGYRSKRVHARFDADAVNPARANRQMYEGRAYFGKPVGASRRRSKRTPDDVRPQRRQPGDDGGEERKRRIVSTKRADVADAKYDERMEDDEEFAEKWNKWKRACTNETRDACRSINRDAKGRFVSFDSDKEIGSVTHWPEEGDDFGWWVRTTAREQSGPYTFTEAKRIAADVKKGKKSGKKKSGRNKSGKKSKRNKSGKRSIRGGARSGPRAAPGPAYPKYSLKPVKPVDFEKYAGQVMCVREDVVKSACEAKGKAIRRYQSGPRTGQEYCGYRKKSKRSKRKSKKPKKK